MYTPCMLCGFLPLNIFCAYLYKKKRQVKEILYFSLFQIKVQATLKNLYSLW